MMLTRPTPPASPAPSSGDGTLHRGLLGGLVIVLLLGLSPTKPERAERLAGAMPVRLDTITTADVRGIASFDDARALAVDPRGRLYVADAGRDVVTVWDADGTRLHTFGGSGARPGRFNTPVDVDPTNGLQLLVADADNSRIQRFSSDGRLLDVLPVRRFSDASAGESVVDPSRSFHSQGAVGRPVAVASTPAQDILALDGRHRTLLRWDANRRVERLAHADAVGDARLRAPVDVALDNHRRLYVADADAVLVFDRFGTFARRFDVPKEAAPIHAITAHDNRLWIVRPHSVTAVSADTGTRLQSSVVALGAPLMDIAFSGSRRYLLTSTRVVRVR